MNIQQKSNRSIVYSQPKMREDFIPAIVKEQEAKQVDYKNRKLMQLIKIQ
jgi:hypothetical protein